ncbi:MAG: hypothetical protein A2583_11185 [Bdellovibrionales bacterium RIFOXYD1_FULL_53_11]|nr:MAG: hypothetical protein A2583_11185 [Bdellovibrionales bacterium RIFOXYD1_FULL_53_11]
MRILITGGAGFAGSRLALLFREKLSAEVTVFDNLRRRGSELNLPEFKKRGIAFVHGDIREAADFDSLEGRYDLFIEASAEPSVLAGMNGGSPAYVLQTNLFGTANCLEYARKACGRLLFLSTSRVYSIAALKALPLVEKTTRLDSDMPGIDENFPVNGFRSIYGMTKLASEMLIEEYVHAYGLKAVINRCGVICGPGQFGKVDQGVFTLWVANHYFGKPLKYTGYGGTGKQVRDLMHPADLFELIGLELEDDSVWNAGLFNAGGGRDVSVSLLEWTAECERATGRSTGITRQDTSASVDIPYYVSDCTRAENKFGWKPKRKPSDIASEIALWIRDNESSLKGLFA